MRLAALVSVTLLSVAACGGEQATAPTPRPTPTPDTELAHACDGDGYVVRYPGGWRVNDPRQVGPCRYFHPTAFTVPEDTEATSIAVSIRFTDVAFARISEDVSSGGPGEDVSSDSAVTVAGRDALRVQTVASGEALLPDGTKATRYYVDFGTRTLIASTLSIASAGTYEGNVEVLDRMMESLRRTDGSAVACSAADEDADIPAQDLPDPVAQMRMDIARAASECDYDRLAQLAGPDFSYSFGAEAGDPTPYWRQQEADARGPQPMRYLLGVLKRPVATVDTERGTTYVWPSAFSYDDWSEVPASAREALKPLYTEEDFESWERFGGYVGYRVGITAGGDWLYFLAGD